VAPDVRARRSAQRDVAQVLLWCPRHACMYLSPRKPQGLERFLPHVEDNPSLPAGPRIGEKCPSTRNLSAIGKARLLIVRAERLVYLSEWSTRRIVIRLEFAERRLEFTVERERDVDLTFSTV